MAGAKRPSCKAAARRTSSRLGRETVPHRHRQGGRQNGAGRIARVLVTTAAVAAGAVLDVATGRLLWGRIRRVPTGAVAGSLAMMRSFMYQLAANALARVRRRVSARADIACSHSL